MSRIGPAPGAPQDVDEVHREPIQKERDNEGSLLGLSAYSDSVREDTAALGEENERRREFVEWLPGKACSQLNNLRPDKLQVVPKKEHS